MGGVSCRIIQNPVWRSLAVGAAILPAFAAYGPVGPAVAADYPSKPITLVIPYRAGGSTETMGRIFSKALGKELGTKVIIRTRPGAGGAVGALEVSKKEPDGYTLLFAAAVSLLWHPLTRSVGFGLDSFTYIGQITNYQQALIARQDAPFNTMKELLAHAKTKRLNYADQGPMHARLYRLHRREGRREMDRHSHQGRR